MSEELLNGVSETLRTVKGIDAMLKTIIDTNSIMAKAHADIGHAFNMMAKTFEKVEERQTQLESTNTELYKNQGIPPRIFFIVSATLCGVIILGTVWITDTFIKATSAGLEAGRKENIKKLESYMTDNKQEILDELRHGN